MIVLPMFGNNDVQVRTIRIIFVVRRFLPPRFSRYPPLNRIAREVAAGRT
jgi:hypothetical protein